VLAALIVLAAYLRPLVCGETFALRDQVTWALPARTFLHDALVRGRVPEWWDAIGLGAPFAANPVDGVTYPPTWIVALVPPAFGSDLLYVVHLAWLALGVSLLARRLGADRTGAALGGAAAALSGFAASAVVDGVPLLALAWTPWILTAVDRVARSDGRRARLHAALLLAGLVAAQILCGIAGVIDSVVAAAVWTVARAERRWPALGWVALGVVSALPLAMVSLLPALHLVGSSERHAGLSYDDATVWSLHPLRLGELVWPRLFGATPPDESAGRALGRTWAFSVYLGVPVVGFAALAAVRRERRLRALGVVALGLLVVALGRYTPLYALYRAVVLPERLVRYPEKHLGTVVVIVAALAGVGFTRAFAAARVNRLAAAFGLVAIAFAVGGALGAALASAAVAAALTVRRPSLALAAVVIELAAEGWLAQPLVPRAALTRVPALLAPIAAATAATTPRPRLYRPPGLEPRSNARSNAEASVAERDTGVENAASPYGFAHVPGFDAALDPRWHAVWDAGAHAGARLLDLFDVQWVVLPAANAARAGFVPRAELGGLALAENPQRRPRAFVSTRWRFASDDDALAALFNPTREGGLELAGSGAPSAASAGAGSGTPCTIRSPRPEAVDLSCRAPAAGYAVLLDSFAAGWSASVDGTPAPILRADVVARAVPIPAGTHTIRFRYRTPGLRAGALVSLLSLLVWLALLLRTRSGDPQPHLRSDRQRQLLE
jgi:hypothetical protein